MKTDLHVQRLLRKDGRCHGLYYIRAEGRIARVAVAREVVPAVGAIRSLHTLQPSGIGDGRSSLLLVSWLSMICRVWAPISEIVCSSGQFMASALKGR
ncbi:GMC family oxidoreductase N-terminal domain-containing protein [Arboricoccus pini]|uniref:GMC family oxidoreductase N-terminal domain-containing protein n=1 Tax=Arboricoccus pini TaxID=1963835 RepID=UPI003899525C